MSAERRARRQADREANWEATAGEFIEPLLAPGEEIVALAPANQEPGIVIRLLSQSSRSFLLVVTGSRLFGVKLSSDRGNGVSFAVERTAIQHLRVSGILIAKLWFEVAGKRQRFFLARSKYNDRFLYAFAGTAYGPARI